MAGVSTTTVSHVINKTRFVAKETEEAVMQAIKSLKYSPQVLLLEFESQYNKIHWDDCYHQWISLFCWNHSCRWRSLLSSRLFTFVCNTQNDPEKLKPRRNACQKRVDGLLVMCSEYTQHSLDVLSRFLVCAYGGDGLGVQIQIPISLK